MAVTAVRLVGEAEPAITVAMWMHSCTLVICVLPLALGWPEPTVLPRGSDALALLGMALTSFAGQLLMTRGLQLIPAGLAQATSFAQVSCCGAAGACAVQVAPITYHHAVGIS